MAEVYAGFLAHADHQIGRLLDYLEETGQRENTLVIVVSDNGASGEGGPNGSVNESKIMNGVPDDIASNLALIDDLGSPRTYNHYPTGWAMAFNTPFKMWKRYEFNGGTSDACIFRGPRASKSRGEVRDQYHHAIDLVPTILDVLGQQPPETIKGHVQSAFDGVSMRYSFDAPDAATTRRTQFYSMLGSRAIWHDGWKAVTTHATVAGWSNFGADTWQLHHTDVDRSELNDLAKSEPPKAPRFGPPLVRRGRGEWRLPPRRPLAIGDLPYPPTRAEPRRDRYIYYPDVAEVPESQAVNIRNRSYVIAALVDIPSPGPSGVLFAQGSRFGGHALYVKENRLHYVYNFLGMEEQRSSPTLSYRREKNLSCRYRSTRTARLRRGWLPARCRSTTARPRWARAASGPSPASSL